MFTVQDAGFRMMNMNIHEGAVLQALLTRTLSCHIFMGPDANANGGDCTGRADRTTSA